VRIEVTPEAVLSVDPEDAVVSRVGAENAHDVRGQVCDHGHFFASAQAASQWAGEHVSGRVLPVREAFERTRRAFQGRASAHRRADAPVTERQHDA